MRQPAAMDRKSDKLSRRGLFQRLVGQGDSLDPVFASAGFDPQIRRADDSLKAGEYRSAIALYERAIQQEPAHLQAREKLGYCYLKIGHTARARDVWQALLELAPDNDFALLYSGLSEAMDGSVDRALEVWKGYRNYKQVHIQRELNVLRFLYERGEELSADEVVQRIEAAIRQSAPSDERLD